MQIELDEARQILNSIWAELAEQDVPPEKLLKVPPEIIEAIERSINSTTKTYRYVLPTQLLAKLTDSSVDCRAIQKTADLENAFDARSLCHGIIVPFDRANHNVLGGSTEPYVSKPVRFPSITTGYRKAQRNKAGFDDLSAVLDYAQQNPRQVKLLLMAVLNSIRTRLGTTKVVYPVPNRISLRAAKSVIKSFLESRSGGLRVQAVAVALFKTIGEHLGLYRDVSSAAVNASDASTGLAADLECVNSKKETVLAVEVKDRKLTLRHVQDKLSGIRERGIRELLFLVQGGVKPEELQEVNEAIDREFNVGQNVYVCEFDVFLECCLVLFGEAARRDLFLNIGKSLDGLSADVRHREAWRDVLNEI